MRLIVSSSFMISLSLPLLTIISLSTWHLLADSFQFPCVPILVRLIVNSTLMRLSDFSYQLPGESIAQRPLEQRDASRMLIVDRQKNEWEDSAFRSFPQR